MSKSLCKFNPNMVLHVLSDYFIFNLSMSDMSFLIDILPLRPTLVSVD